MNREKTYRRLSIIEKVDIVFDGILNRLSQRKLAKKYKCSLETVNTLLKPENVSRLMDLLAKSGRHVRRDEVIQITDFLKKSGLVVEGRRLLESELSRGRVNEQSETERRISHQQKTLDIIEKGSYLAAAGLQNALAQLVTLLNQSAESQKNKEGGGLSIEDLVDISAEVRSILATFARLNPVLAQPEALTVQQNNNIQVNLASAFAEMMEKDERLRGVLPFRPGEIIHQAEETVEYKSPERVIDFKERAKLPPPGESLLNNPGKTEDIEEPPESNYDNSRVLEILAQIR